MEVAKAKIGLMFFDMLEYSAGLSKVLVSLNMHGFA